MRPGSEIFNPGAERFNGHYGDFATIHDMADKPGYLGKEIPFQSFEYKNFEDFKRTIAESSAIVDKYLKDYLPNYYFTFGDEDKDKTPSAYFFMEEVVPAANVPPVGELDNFLYSCCRMFEETQAHGKTFGVDINKMNNLVYGATKDNPENKLYLVDLFPTYFGITAEKLRAQISLLSKGYDINQLPKTASIITKIK